MGQCHKCNFPLKDGAIACPQCGDVIVPLDDSHGTVNQLDGEISKTIEFTGGVDSVSEPVSPSDKTIDFAAEKTIDLSQQTVDFSASDYVAQIAKVRDDLDSEIELDDAGTGTVDALGPDPISSQNDLVVDDDEMVMELEEEFESDVERQTLDATGGPGQVGADESGSTHVAVDPSGAFGDDQMTYVVSPNSPFTAEHSDDVGTIQLPSMPSENAGERTAVSGLSESAPGTMEAGSSGSEGRLKRLWDGVVGSSENPMHSLQATGLEASDSIFERVATRRVADGSARGDLEADYQIVNKLGEGAMGIVFSARQTTIDRVVALKMAKPSFQQNEESRRRFLYEAQITADLDHSNIVPIHELGANESGMLFYSMKLVQGTGWNAVIRKKTREQNLEIYMKVTDAIAFAHSKGVIHRDLKPENTMLGRFGEVFVTDWGTAVNLTKDTTRLARPAMQGDKFITVQDGKKFRRGDTIAFLDDEEVFEQRQITSIDDIDPNRLYLRKKLSHTYDSVKDIRVMRMINMAGTPCYMSPEMAGHDLPKISKLSDVYVLGAILYDIVTGRAPHTGKSVTECLRAALDNDVVIKGNDDPLLTIAYKAMESDPANRYQSVEELQDAVREYRRHAESIALTDRSDDLLEQAMSKGDYEMYSRTVFGYRDAIELWPENQSAVAGLKKSRLAFGEAAFKKGDYDLVLQTVDRTEPPEDALFLRAVEAKKKGEDREKALKKLQKAIAAVVLFAVVGLSVASIFAFSQWAKATFEQKKAIALADKNAKLAESESQLRVDAERLAGEKDLLAKSELSQKLAAKESERLAKEAEKVAREAEKAARAAEKTARDAELAEKTARASEVEQARLARIAEKLARESEALAKQRAAAIQLGEYSSSLALAKSQFESFDVAQGQASLTKLKNLPVSVFADAAKPDVPDFYTWGWQRINLLSNGDLPMAELQDAVTASDCAAKAGVAVFGTKGGLVQVLKRDGNALTKQAQYVEAGAEIKAVAISPDGSECVFAFVRNREGGMKRWSIAEGEPSEVVAAGKRQFQRIAYTQDGGKLVAGINSGIWIWQRDAKWSEQKKPSRVESIRGDLLSLQSISPMQVFVSSQLQGASVQLSLLDHNSGAVKSVTLPRLDDELRTAAHTLVDNKVMLGLANNQLLVGTLDPAAGTIQDIVELDDKHRSPVTAIVADGAGRVVTASESEPVAHVWKYTNKEWLYDTNLTGTPSNLAGIGALGVGQVLGVDGGGVAIVWDIERQKQRTRLQRQAKGSVEAYASPVFGVVAGASEDAALAIDENGVVDRWSLVDGSSELIDAQRWSYVGHTPGAELVDSAIDLERGVVITAARLRNAEKKYLANPEHDWEFCIWDAISGAMNKRWSVENRKLEKHKSESVEQRISLVFGGEQILFSSDRETRFVDLDSGKESFVKSDFGSFFAVPHPQRESLTMLVKRSGAVRLFDRQQPATWDNLSLQEFTLAGSSEQPLRGVWSGDGKRFYLAFSAGGLAAFDWNGSRLKLTWSNRKLEDDPKFERLREAMLIRSGRVRSHLDMDLMVDDSSGVDVVSIASRNREQDGETKLIQLKFAGADPVLVDERVTKDVRWLQNVNGQVALSNRLHDTLVLDAQRIRTRQMLNGKIFVSTDSAQVFGLQEGKQQVTSYGRAKLVSATGARDGQSILVLLEDGAIWKFTAAEKNPWQRLSYSALGARKLKVSADGSKLVVESAAGVKVLAAESGAVLADLGVVAAANWDAAQGARLAIAKSDGSLAIWSGGQSEELKAKADVSIGEIIDVQFFKETWKNKSVAPREHLLIQTENTQHGRLQFVPVDGAQLVAKEEKGESEKAEVRTLLKGTRVQVSPTEGIIVSGAQGGTVTVWYATPSFEADPRQLFDLEGHRGGQITTLAFSNDGKTIITADDEQRLFAWLSSDPLTRK